MAESFYTILTNIGKAQIANASALGTKVKFTTLKLGDGGGNYYNPTETQTSLRHEVWSGNIGNIIVDTDNSNWIVLETVIPANVGGFMIRECGIADDEGNLLAVGKYPETYKPVVSEGSSKDLRIRTILEVVNTAAVTLKVDLSTTLATKEDLEFLKNSIPKNASDIGAVANSQIGVTGGVAKQDDLTTLADDFDTHKAENATESQKGHIQLATAAEVTAGTEATKAVTPKNLKTELDKKLNVFDYNPHDVDNGRYQSQFGFDNAILNNCNNYKSVIDLNTYALGLSKTSTSGSLYAPDVAGTGSIGARLKNSVIATSNIKKVSIFINVKDGNGSDLELEIYDSTSSTSLGKLTILKNSISVGAYTDFVFDNAIAIDRTHIIDFRLVAKNGSSGDGWGVCGYTSDVSTNQYMLTSANPWGTTTEQTSYAMLMFIYGETRNLSGTVVKTYTPSDLKKWGNVKWTQTTVASGSTVACDVFDNGTSIADSTPTMTSNSLPSGIVSASSYQSGYDPYKAFDKSTSTKWIANSTSASAYIQYQFLSTKNVRGFSFSTITDLSSYSNVPVTAQGSNDGTNWTDLYNFNCNLPANTKKYFVVGSLKAFTYFRFICTANFGGYFEAREIEIFESVLLKSNITSLQELSDINISTYSSIQLRWTLTRTAPTDTSPTVGNPSVTWEGKYGGDGTWEKITEVTLASSVSQVDFQSLGLDKYRFLKLICNVQTSSTINLTSTFNDDTSASYANAQINSTTGSTGVGLALGTSVIASNMDGEIVLDVYNNVSGKRKHFEIFQSCFNGSAYAFNKSGALWNNSSSAITKISISASPGQINSGGKFILLGVK